MVVTFSEYAFRQEYSNLMEQWEYLRMNDSFLISEADGWLGRLGRNIRDFGSDLGRELRGGFPDTAELSQYYSRQFSMLLDSAKKKAKELMSMGFGRLQAILAEKGHPALLQKLDKYKNGLLILGIIGAGGLMALLPNSRTMDPAEIDRALSLPEGSYEQMDPEVKKVIMTGEDFSREERSQDANAFANKFGDNLVTIDRSTGMTRTKFSDQDGNWLVYKQEKTTSDPADDQNQRKMFMMRAQEDFRDQTGKFPGTSPDSRKTFFYGFRPDKFHMVAYKIGE